MSFHHALQQLKAEINGMHERYHSFLGQQGYVDRSCNVATSSNPFRCLEVPDGRTFPKITHGRTFHGGPQGCTPGSIAFEQMNSRLGSVDDRVSRLEAQVMLINAAPFTPPASVTSEDQWSSQTSTQTHPPVQTTDQKPNNASQHHSEEVQLGCIFHPELDRELVSSRDRHKYTADSALFVAKLRHAVFGKRAEYIGKHLRGSALRWFNLGFSQSGEHCHDDSDGNLNIEKFSSDLLLVFGDSNTAVQSMSKATFTDSDVRRRVSIVSDYALPIFEQARSIRHITHNERQRLAVSMIREGIQCDTSFFDWDKADSMDLSNYLAELRSLEGFIKDRVFKEDENGHCSGLSLSDCLPVANSLQTTPDQVINDILRRETEHLGKQIKDREREIGMLRQDLFQKHYEEIHQGQKTRDLKISPSGTEHPDASIHGRLDRDAIEIQTGEMMRQVGERATAAATHDKCTLQDQQNLHALVDRTIKPSTHCADAGATCSSEFAPPREHFLQSLLGPVKPLLMQQPGSVVSVSEESTPLQHDQTALSKHQMTAPLVPYRLHYASADSANGRVGSSESEKQESVVACTNCLQERLECDVEPTKPCVHCQDRGLECRLWIKGVLRTVLYANLSVQPIGRY